MPFAFPSLFRPARPFPVRTALRHGRPPRFSLPAFRFPLGPWPAPSSSAFARGFFPAQGRTPPSARRTLLLSNFAVAGGITVTVISIETRYTVIVHNVSQQPLSGVRVFGGGCEADFGTIPPGGVVRRSFWIQHDGKLEFRAVSGATTHSKTIDGYVTHGMRGHTTVTINPDGTISVSKKTPNCCTSTRCPQF